MLSDAELLRRIQAGDQSACDLCIEKHRPRLYALALGLLGHEADAEDVVQESFLNAFKAIDKFEGRSSLSTWLYRITYNNALMRQRRARSEPVADNKSVEGIEEESTVPQAFFDWCCLPERDLQKVEVRQQLENAFETLSPALRAVFELRELHDMSTRETAVTLGVSEDVVKTRLRRARGHLRKELDDYLSPDTDTAGETPLGI